MDKLLFHQFGNYVLQKMVEVVPEHELRVGMIERIKQWSEELQKTKHGAKVLMKLQKTYPQQFQHCSSADVSFDHEMIVQTSQQ